MTALDLAPWKLQQPHAGYSIQAPRVDWNLKGETIAGRMQMNFAGGWNLKIKMKEECEKFEEFPPEEFRTFSHNIVRRPDV